MLRRNKILASLAFSSLGLAPLAPGCGGNNGGTATDDGGPPMTQPDLAMAPMCPARTVTCTDQSVQDLALFKKVSTRVVENMADGGGFLSHVDATGGGFTPSESFVYAKFTDTGLMRVDVSDEAAFNSQEWHIAFRRYQARLNSGVSGPGCVVGAELSNVKYDSLNALPQGTKFASEAYYDDKCTLQTDQSGLGAPGTILSDYWQYSQGMCVQMTGAVYALQLADGRKVKLTITSYYPPTAQTMCDQQGTVPQGTAGAQIRFRWAFLK